MEKYVKREITSAKLAELTGYNAVYLRRSIVREPRPNHAQLKRERQYLRKVKVAFQDKLANLPISDIVKQANVSVTTARRIKERNKK